MAQAPKSLLPEFGTEGKEFTAQAKDGNTVKGWLPNQWTDNSHWAAVSATYSKLADSPDKAVGAVRIKVEKADENGHVQFTSYGGNQKYKKGTRYLVTGWVRSPDRVSLHIGVRQIDQPYEFYFDQDQSAGPDWQKFEFAFTPAMDFSAFLMLFVRDAGAVDVAGVAIEEKP